MKLPNKTMTGHYIKISIVVILLGLAIHGLMVDELTLRGRWGVARFYGDSIYLMLIVFLGMAYVVLVNYLRDRAVRAKTHKDDVRTFTVISFALVLVVVAFSINGQDPKTRDMNGVGNKIAEYLISGRSDLRITFVSYKPGHIGLSYKVLPVGEQDVMSDAYRRSLSSLFRSRVCRVESELQLQLVSNVISISVMRGGSQSQFVLNQSINRDKCR